MAEDYTAGALLRKIYFLQEKGYKYEVIIMQENQSTKMLLDNGREISSNRNRHINSK